MIIIHANLKVRADQEQTFLKEAQSLVLATRNEEGNISYELMKSSEKENEYTMVELWKDAEATELHNKSEHFTAFVQKAPTFMAAPMEVKVFAGEQLEV
ncbi:putative quinol monooxygenase [Bacillus sp. B1-b2]|uniref:putative quinol monooxygenase n=1 Tax=Bacillus sp. B1-b2 TaxID=2653201 RepID=UPI0012625897|nr:putative quinol monooxygenase [Bacillus sp. B1-b2]KAB7672590.1 antibiotic biosynthesis monooxygenase [Bacillus sp. B1-b2]